MASSPFVTKTTTLLLIDVQNDFHPPTGSLAIPGADVDANRIVNKIIRKSITTSTPNVNNDTSHSNFKIDRILVTLDTHPKLHIAHPYFWCKDNDTDEENHIHVHPQPFTIITTEDIKNRIWIPRPDLFVPEYDTNETTNNNDSSIDPTIFTNSDHIFVTTNDNENGKKKKIDMYQYCIEYTSRLEQKGKFQLCIWPEHCLMGSNGHNVVPVIQESLYEWSNRTGKNVEYIEKGQNMLTEMYSVISADVPVNQQTSTNVTLLQSLFPLPSSPVLDEQQQQKQQHRLLICGQALSHCVNYSVRDIVQYCQQQQEQQLNNGTSNTQQFLLENIYLLLDCTSPVPGFEKEAEQFVQDMKQVGIQCITTDEIDTLF